jgi:LemA protein
LAQYTQFEKSTLEKVTELRQQILNLNLNNTDVSQLQHVEKLNQDLMKSLNVVVENYPELKADTLYAKMMDDIQEQNENVGAAITIFNRNVEEFNNTIEIFPNNMINTITLAKKTIRHFPTMWSLRILITSLILTKLSSKFATTCVFRRY